MILGLCVSTPDFLGSFLPSFWGIIVCGFAESDQISIKLLRMGLGFIQVPKKVFIGLIIFYNRKTNYFKRSSYATDSFLFFANLVHSLRHLILELYEGCIVYIWKVLQIFKEKKHENSLLIAAPSNKHPLKNKLWLINSHGFHCPQWASIRNLGQKIDGLLLASSKTFLVVILKASKVYSKVQSEEKEVSVKPFL